jgi:hypothetical protein
VSVNTVRRWVDAYMAWCRDAGHTPGPDSPPPPAERGGLIKGWTLPERRGAGDARAVDLADVERVRARYGMPPAGPIDEGAGDHSP